MNNIFALQFNFPYAFIVCLDNEIMVEGSLGGLQVLDLSSENQIHQRIVSIGRDPLLDAPHPLYTMTHNADGGERKAFNFVVTRSIHSGVIRNIPNRHVLIYCKTLRHRWCVGKNGIRMVHAFPSAAHRAAVVRHGIQAVSCQSCAVDKDGRHWHGFGTGAR